MAHITFYFIAAALACPVSAFAASPYVGDESREIKALSDQEIWHLRYVGNGAGHHHAR